jgi:hypothetical protein
MAKDYVGGCCNNESKESSDNVDVSLGPGYGSQKQAYLSPE